jgi:hypothetical protein
MELSVVGNMKFDHSKKPPLVSSRPAAAQKLLTAKSAEKTDAKIAEKNDRPPKSCSAFEPGLEYPSLILKEHFSRAIKEFVFSAIFAPVFSALFALKSFAQG